MKYPWMTDANAMVVQAGFCTPIFPDAGEAEHPFYAKAKAVAARENVDFCEACQRVNARHPGLFDDYRNHLALGSVEPRVVTAKAKTAVAQVATANAHPFVVEARRLADFEKMDFADACTAAAKAAPHQYASYRELMRGK